MLHVLLMLAPAEGVVRTPLISPQRVAGRLGWKSVSGRFKNLVTKVNWFKKRSVFLPVLLSAHSLLSYQVSVVAAETRTSSEFIAQIESAPKTEESFYPVITGRDFIKNCEKQTAWDSHERERLYQAGRKLLDEKDYLKALDYLNQSLELGADERAAIAKADCLGHLSRLPEAVSLLKKFSRNSSENSTRLMLVDDLIKLGQFDEADTECDKWQNYYLRGGNSFLLRSHVARAKGDAKLAQKYLFDGYFHCKRYETDSVGILDALYEQGLTPPDKVPFPSEGNGDVYKAIGFLQKLKRPANEREYSSLFQKVFNAVGYPNGQNSVHNWSYVDCKAPIESIELTIGAKAPVRMQVNQDLCSVHFEDISSKYRYLIVPEESARFELRELPTSDGKVIALRCDDGYVVCDFGRTHSGMLEAIYRLFTTLPGPETLGGALSLKEHISSVESLLAKKDLRKARAELIAHWTDEYPDAHTTTSRHKMLLQKRELLTAAYADQTEVQSYLRVACLAFISQDIDKLKTLGEELPTIAEFKTHKWKLNAMVAAPNVKEAEYNVWVETYPTIYVPQTADLFRILYRKSGKDESYGPGPNYVPMEPVERRLLDDATLAANLYFEANK